MAEMKDFKGEWQKRQQAMMKDWHEQVEAERERWKQKEAVLAQRRAQKKREAQVLLKVQAMDAARAHLQDLVPRAVSDLGEAAFPDDKGVAITASSCPSSWARSRGTCAPGRQPRATQRERRPS